MIVCLKGKSLNLIYSSIFLKIIIHLCSVSREGTDTFCAEMSWQPKDADWKLPQCEVEQANPPKIACLYYTYFRFTVSYKDVQTRKIWSSPILLMEEILHHPTTQHVWNPENNQIFTISTGARRISEPSTVSPWFFGHANCPHLAPPASEVMDEVLNFTAFRIPGAEPTTVMDGWITNGMRWRVGELFKEWWNDEIMYFTYWFYVDIYLYHMYIFVFFSI